MTEPRVAAPHRFVLTDQLRQRIAESAAHAPPLNAQQRALLRRCLAPHRTLPDPK